eukprot:364988-Chlamydomonas_euryale.AAC.29
MEVLHRRRPWFRVLRAAVCGRDPGYADGNSLYRPPADAAARADGADKCKRYRAAADTSAPFVRPALVCSWDINCLPATHSVLPPPHTHHHDDGVPARRWVCAPRDRLASWTAWLLGVKVQRPTLGPALKFSLQSGRCWATCCPTRCPDAGGLPRGSRCGGGARGVGAVCGNKMWEWGGGAAQGGKQPDYVT